MKKRVLFVCIHNSARSQMAEAFLNTVAGDRFTAESAGLERGTLNPVVVEAMRDINIDISQNKSNTVDEFSERTYDYVITVCDESSSEKCPLFPGKGKRLHWGFEDPSDLSGSIEEKLASTISIRNHIKKRIDHFVANN